VTMETIDALEDQPDASLEDAQVESETVGEDEVDPQAELKARLDAMEQELGRFKGLDPNAVKANLGRIPALQSAIDDLKRGALPADVVDRLDLSDRALGTLANLMVSDTEQSETVKGPFREYLSGIEKAKTQRERNALRSELLEEIKPAAQQTSGPQSDPAVETQIATVNRMVLAAASRAGVDPTTIPFGQLQAQANDDIAAAGALALDWIESNRAPEPAARVAERRRSAGNGSPQREGGGNTIERDLQRLSSTGIPIEDEAARKRVAESLGISL
jgi:hypothetical protein